MSGYKFSTVNWEKEREEYINLLLKIKESREKLEGVTGSLKDLLARTPTGIKSLFADEVSQAKAWIERMKNISITDYHIERQSLMLEAEVEQGKSLLTLLLTHLRYKAQSIERGLIIKSSELQTTYSINKGILERWFGNQAASEYTTVIGKVNELLGENRLQEAIQNLADAEGSIKKKVEEAQQLDSKQEKRLHLLKSLRQVCTEMGFQESEPFYTDREDHRSEIIYDVDTVDQGKIRFFLALDNIRSHSDIYEGKCFEEFDKLSRYLDSEYGVKTKFHQEAEEPLQKLIEKEELELPNYSQREKPL